MISLKSIFNATNNISRIIINSSLRPGVLQCQPAAGVKTLEEKLGLPPRPKKPLTPFFRFMKQMRPVILAENPDLKVTDIVKLISKKWESAEPTLKIKLQEQYKKDKIAYVESRAKYDSKITDEQRSEIKQLKENETALKERRLTRKRIAELNRPKKPPSAFLLFIGQERKLSPQGPNETYRDWHSKTTAKWARLTDEQKEVFLQDFRQRLEKYKKDIVIWEEKMVRLGNIDVVRSESLIDPPIKSKPRLEK